MGIYSVKPRREARYPFRVKHESTRAVITDRVNTVITDVIPMIRKMVTKRNLLNLPSQITDEIFANCLSFLWQRALPKYDAWRYPRVKPSTYIHRCLERFVMREYRRVVRSMHRQVEIISTERITSHPASDELLDRKIESQARDIILQPEEYMPRDMASRFRILMDNPGATMQELGHLMGYKNPSALSMMLKRMREVVSNVDIEQYATERP